MKFDPIYGMIRDHKPPPGPLRWTWNEWNTEKNEPYWVPLVSVRISEAEKAAFEAKINAQRETMRRQQRKSNRRWLIAIAFVLVAYLAAIVSTWLTGDDDTLFVLIIVPLYSLIFLWLSEVGPSLPKPASTIEMIGGE